jgi:hypothetical protein
MAVAIGSVAGMKALQPRMDDALSGALAAELETVACTLFRRYPGLHGFSVQPMRTLAHYRKACPLDAELFLADVEFNPWSESEPAELLAVIAKALLDLIDECPEARELLRGRSFARSRH